MDKMSLIRTILLFVALINMFLVAAGYSPLPFDNELLELAVGTSFTIVTSLWTWWKNNYISKRGQKQKEVLDQNGLYKP